MLFYFWIYEVRKRLRKLDINLLLKFVYGFLLGICLLEISEYLIIENKKVGKLFERVV